MPKALGADILTFWNDDDYKFPLGDVEYECDDGTTDIDNLNYLMEYELNDLGWFNYVNSDSSITVADAFKNWKESQTHTQLLINVPIELMTEVRSFLMSKGIKWIY